MTVLLSSPSFSSFFLQHTEEEGNDSNVAIAFFVALRYNTVPQEDEEGDGNCCRLLHCTAAQRSKTRDEELSSPSSLRLLMVQKKKRRR
jgi:hypothetical protein